MKTLLLAGALLAMATGSSFAQDCNGGCQGGCESGNCGASAGPMDGGFGYGGFDGGYVDAGYGGEAQFGYPGNAGQCGSCGTRGGGCSCMKDLKSKWEHQKALNQRVMARNRVWPRPFDCADRQLYFSIWEPMLDAGYEKHCTLTPAHFISDSNELNDYGKSAVAGVMRNMPKHRKTIFIHRDVDQQISDARMNSVRSAVTTWFGPETNASLAFTDKYPTRSSGGRIEAINKLYNDGTPAPIIPVATGSGGVGTGN